MIGDTHIDIYWCHFGWRNTISRVGKAIVVVEMFHKIYFSPLCFLIIGDTRTSLGGEKQFAEWEKPLRAASMPASVFWPEED